MQIMYQMLDNFDAVDCSTNPEILLMTAEQDESECDVAESQWLASQAVTKPQSVDH